METLLCPLCGQPVTKRLYDKITGIWGEKQRIIGVYQQKIDSLKKEKVRLRELFYQNKKKFQDKFKSKSALEIKRRTKRLEVRILQLNNQKNETIKKMQQKICSAIHKTELLEKRKYERSISQIKKELKMSAKAELRSKIKERELRLKQYSQQRIDKYQKERELAIIRTQSLTRTTEEQRKKIDDLQNQLKKQITPQVEGLLYEDKLLSALKYEFPEDVFRHTGKGGDILQSVMYKGKSRGIIVYECKRVLKFTKSHINQTAKAKRQRDATYAILVTNATTRGYSGFKTEKGVIIIHPAGVLFLAKLLRRTIIQIANLGINKAQRDNVIQKIMEYMESASFKNSLEHLVQLIISEWEDLKKEVKEHNQRWKRKVEAYREIYNEVVKVKQKTLDTVTGEKSKAELLSGGLQEDITE